MHLVDDAWDSVLESQLLQKKMISQKKKNGRFLITRQMLVSEHGGASIVIGGMRQTVLRIALRITFATNTSDLSTSMLFAVVLSREKEWDETRIS
jgi:hypothetical protein